MSKNHGPIRVGDLVYVVRTCCDTTFAEMGGRIGIIVWVKNKTTCCEDCGTMNDGPHASIKFGRNGAPIAWLKRIDPPPHAGHSGKRRSESVST